MKIPASVFSRKLVIAVAAASALLLPASGVAAKQLGHTIYSFAGPPNDGSHPQLENPMFDSGGALYGTTNTGGSNDNGTVFRLKADGTEQILYSFGTGEGGASPTGTLWIDGSGNIYGTANNIVFELVNNNGQYTEKTIYDSGGQAEFKSGLTVDKKGNFYGTSGAGGDFSDGYVFKLDKKHHFSILHSFNGTDGSTPYAGVVIDKTGNLYGTTYIGGTFDENCSTFYCGVVYKLAPDGTYTVLSYLTGGGGCNPMAGLLMDKQGNLFGTTVGGGTVNGQVDSYGTVFEVSSAGTYHTLYNFHAMADGGAPYATLIEDSQGNLYGTGGGGGAGNGVVFRVTQSGKESVLDGFVNGQHDGNAPMGGLAWGPNGNLYGFTSNGGSDNCASEGGCGTIFESKK